MSRWAWTGHSGTLTPAQCALVALDVATTVQNHDQVGQGGSKGVDEVVLATALLLKQRLDVKVVTFPADGEARWGLTCAPIELIRSSDEVHWRENGWKYLERDRALVEWADYVRAMPLHDFRYVDGWIVPQRGSGTNYTARLAENSKLIGILPLDVFGHIERIQREKVERVHGPN